MKDPLKPRDKITQKMTRDGLVEVNETQQTAERISKRTQDADFQKSLEQQAAQDAAQDTNTPRKYRDRARCRVSIKPAAAAIMTTLLCRPQGTSGTFGLSIPYRIRAGILPPIPRSSRKRAYWRAVRQAALSLTRFLEAAPPGLQRKALTAAISALN